MNYLLLTLYSIAWVFIIYGFNRAIAKHPLKTKVSKITLYVITMAALGVLGEVVFDTVYKQFFDRPLWLYHVMPIHYGYTSIYSVFLWGTVGFYMYLLQGTLKRKRITSLYILATLFCIESVIFEVLVNLSYRALFKDYIFYYLPGDLWHITSIQAVPLYLLAGSITVRTFDYAKSRQQSAIIGSTAIVIILIGTGLLVNS